jgi:3',5'-cyclic AMP phosphodiesterase CpdA
MGCLIMNKIDTRQTIPMTRRGFLGGAMAAGMGAITPAVLGDASGNGSTTSVDDSGFTFVHLTDMHVTPKRWGDKGYRRCLESVRDLKPKPAFLLMGGDLAFDGLYTPRADFEEQIRLYREITNGFGIPHQNCMGNHDVLGWSSRRKVTTDDPGLGKKLIMDRLEWEKSYYSFDFGGWHFVVLDSIFPITAAHGPTYEPRIGDEQLEWLAYDLGAAAGKPTIVVTHIAAFCNLGQLNGDPQRKAMDGNMVLWDTHRLRAILERHGVKALLQGHSHVIEEYRFNHVWYLTSAAVSGAWWAGGWGGKVPGYTVFQCRGDALTWEHVAFPWEAHLEPDDELERKKIAEEEEAKKEQLKLRDRERGRKRAVPVEAGP